MLLDRSLLKMVKAMSKFGMRIKKELNVFSALLGRHFRIFFKNKLTLLFALMVPSITIVIYMIFLRSLEMNMVGEVLKAYETLPGYEAINAASSGLVDSWMFGGLLGVSCISVSLNSCYIVIRDRESGVNRDFISSPISTKTVFASYLVVNVLITFVINFVILIIVFILLATYGNFHLSFVNALGLIFTLFISIVSAATVTIFFVSFVRTEGVYNSIIAIVSTALGFLIGAYMPMKMLPKAAAYICLFFPGTYSVGMFRTFFMNDQISYCYDVMKSNGISEADALKTIDVIKKDFSMNVNFFGFDMDYSYMLLVLVIFILIGFILALYFSSGTTRIFDKTFKRKQKKN